MSDKPQRGRPPSPPQEKSVTKSITLYPWEWAEARRFLRKRESMSTLFRRGIQALKEQAPTK